MTPILLALLDKTKENSLTCARLTETMKVLLPQWPMNRPRTLTDNRNCRGEGGWEGCMHVVLRLLIGHTNIPTFKVKMHTMTVAMVVNSDLRKVG